jgi:glycosyltransferase involved in cell wall biosynthesis
MACGVPVVATAAGGFPEFVRHGVDGFLHEPGDIGAMGRSALSILEDRDALRRFSEEAVTRAGQFETALLVERYEAFYRRLVDARPPRRRPEDQ